jgi:Flagellar biosynthesis protein, FliO
MIVKIRFQRSHSSGSRQRLAAPLPESVPTGASFHATLSDCAEDWVVQRAPRQHTPPMSLPVSRPKASQPQPRRRGMLARAWSWMHRKYALAATRRLRVAETMSLGEKRFVSIVSVDGREFLIGGGTSGVSLLAQLGTASESPDARLRELSAQGDSE